MFEFRDLFQWDRFITPTIIKTFYWLVIALICAVRHFRHFFRPGRDGDQPVRRIHRAVVLDRQRGRRHRVFAHRRGIHPDRVPHQRASRRDPRPGRMRRRQRHRAMQARELVLRGRRSGAPEYAIALSVEPEMHDVAVGDDIFLAFQPQLAGIAGAGFAAERDVIGIGDGFGADKALFEIGVDHAGGGRRLGAAVDGPGPRLLRPDGEIGDEVEQLIAGADQAVETGFLQAERVEKLGALLARQRRDLGFDLGGDGRPRPRLPFRRVRTRPAKTCCPWRRNLPRHCRRRAPAWRSTGRACRRRAPPRPCARETAPACPRAAAPARG